MRNIFVGRPITVRYAPRTTLDAWAGGVYRIPLPYPVSFNVRPTPMKDWIRETGQWFDRHDRTEPSWYQNRREEWSWD